MAKTPSRSSVNLTGTVDDLILDLEKERKERAARQPATTFDVIRKAYDTLAGMKSDGWTDTEICESLKGRGVQVSAGTFATYMKRIAREKREGKPKTGRKPKTDSTASRTDLESVRKNDSSRDRAEVRTDSGSRPSADIAPRTSAPSMAGFASRKPPALDA